MRTAENTGLAYRMARFVLTHRDPLAEEVRHAATLQVDANHPVARQVAAGAHGGLLTLQRSLNDKGMMRTVITVDETRENTNSGTDSSLQHATH